MSLWNLLFGHGLHLLLITLVLIFKFDTIRLVGVVFSSFSSFYPGKKLDTCINTLSKRHKIDKEKGILHKGKECVKAWRHNEYHEYK